MLSDAALPVFEPAPVWRNRAQAPWTQTDQPRPKWLMKGVEHGEATSRSMASTASVARLPEHSL